MRNNKYLTSCSKFRLNVFSVSQIYIIASEDSMSRRLTTHLVSSHGVQQKHQLVQ